MSEGKFKEKVKKLFTPEAFKKRFPPEVGFHYSLFDMVNIGVAEILDEANKDFPMCKENTAKGTIARGLQGINNINEYLTEIDSWKKKWLGE